MNLRVLLAAVLCFSTWAAYLAAKPPTKVEPDDAPAKVARAKAEQSQFLRIVRDKAGNPTALQTAVARYTATEGRYAGVTVDLIGAVHVGERDYYGKLNELFTKYDALLYELVAPKGTKIPKGENRRTTHPVGLMQVGMSDMLGLVHQMTEVDYTKKNFVHADMTPDEFAAKMKERGESWWSMAFRAMGQGIAQQAARPNERPEFEMLAALFDKNPEQRMKRALATQFEDMEGVIDAFGGEDGSTIITERNKKALSVLEKQLKRGRKVVGVFYGAGHLPDMHDRLLGEFGLKLVTTDWLTAWDMSDAKPAAVEKPKPAEDPKPAAPKKPKKSRPIK